jgi:hypothetical protein
MSDDRPLITANMKVGALLTTFPELEQVLVDLAPPFKKLRNPVLRRTVAQVTTLAQAARVAGVAITDLIQTLRQAAGQAPDGDAAPAENHQDTVAGPAPDWVREGEIAAVLNADEAPSAGESPLATVQGHLRRLQSHQVLVIEGSSRPEPLIDLLCRQGHPIYVDGQRPGQIRTIIGPTG